MDNIPLSTIWMIGTVAAAYTVFVTWLCLPQEAMKDGSENRGRKEKILKVITDDVEAMIDEVADRGEHR